MIEPWLQQKVAFGFIGAMLLTSSLGWLGWHNKKTSSAQADSVSHTYIVINQLERILEHVVDVETGARGFAATLEINSSIRIIPPNFCWFKIWHPYSG